MKVLLTLCNGLRMDSASQHATQLLCCRFLVSISLADNEAMANIFHSQVEVSPNFQFIFTFPGHKNPIRPPFKVSLVLLFHCCACYLHTPLEPICCSFRFRQRTRAMAMASTQTLGRWMVKMCSASKSREPRDGNREQVDVNLSSRRWAVAVSASAVAACLSLVSPSPMSVALARERRNRKTIPPEDYLTGPDGLKYYDFVQGSGPVAAPGATVQVHFDCVYRGITAVSSRESKLLAGNRAIAQPYEFKVGSPPGKERKRDYVDNPNGLFSAQAAPKPPPAMYKITQGMRVGGKRTVIVPPEAGYGQKGMNEIPPGATFHLNIELLQVEALEKKVS